MASIQSIRKHHLRQMAATAKCNAFMAEHGPWLSFPCMDGALAFLHGILAPADGTLSATITGDGSGVALPEIAASRFA